MAKWLSEENLQIAEKRREAKGKGEKERYTYLNAEFQRIARRDKKAFLRQPFGLFAFLFPGNGFSLSPVHCHESPSIVLQALCLSDLIP